MKLPIIVYEKYDIYIHPTVKHAEDHFEVQDLECAVYIVYDAEGYLLDLTVEKIREDRQLIFFKWIDNYEKVKLSEHLPIEKRENELRENLITYLSWKSKDQEIYKDTQLEELISEAGKKMPWKVR